MRTLKRIKLFESFLDEGRRNYTRANFGTYPYQMYFRDGGMADAVGAGSEQELIDNVAIPRKLKDFAIFRKGSGFHSTTQEEFLVSWYDKDGGSYWFNRAQKEPELMDKRIESLGHEEEEEESNVDPMENPGDYIEQLDATVESQDRDAFDAIINPIADAMDKSGDLSIKEVFDKFARRDERRYKSILNQLHDLHYEED